VNGTLSLARQSKIVSALRFLPLAAKLECEAAPQIDTRKSGVVKMTVAPMHGMMERLVMVDDQEQNHRGFQPLFRIRWR
jgi:hypothetical protein